MRVHPHEYQLEELAAALPGEHLDLLQHLAGCESCRQRLAVLRAQRSGPLAARLAGVLPWPTAEPEYDQALSAVQERLLGHARALATERAEAPARLAELREQTPERRGMLMRNHPRFQTWGLLELLAEQSRERSFEDPEEGEEMARLGLSLADRLDAGLYGADRIDDLRGRLWAYLGNARRLRSDLAGAEEAFASALRHLRRGSGDLLERAVVLDLQASLRRDQRRFADAMRLLVRALRAYRDLGENHRAGRLLVKMSTLHEHAGEPERAIPLLSEALELLDPEREPRALLAAHHNLVTNLAEAGRFMEAHKLLIQTRPLYARFDDGWTRHRRSWVEGRIAQGLGQLREAEIHLRAARDGFAAEGVPYDAALVSLDLAALYAGQDRMADLKRLAEEMLPVFSSRRIEREVLAALAFLRQAVAAERVSLELIARVASFLKRLELEPGLSFQAPA
jgi:tetratricopeptide (TPR) repeat protein